MQSANVERLRQAFPKLYRNTLFECDDRWFSLLLSIGARLEKALRNERARRVVQSGANGQDPNLLDDECVEVVLETSETLEISLHEDTPTLMRVLEQFEPQLHHFQRAGASRGTYQETHNHAEQTLAEEAIRADQGAFDTAADAPAGTPPADEAGKTL